MSDPDGTDLDPQPTETPGIVSPGSTATGAGTSDPADPAEFGTTEADVSDGSEQKQPRQD
ncbi:hypothetical protein EYE40_04545 [Glaciihabitans arcticus]|uniref:Uncharacterized protein n=1 Tax=Glaciihabitans arcticus TaxID=2668039 RepID=A0A4Q9GPL6_9MICO|nr:hypothetical protein [Glaciihabitans arcticus]TBN56726.1 hypothetical protein EYE40_04545 [Glaciihabitans arcticus]